MFFQDEIVHVLFLQKGAVSSKSVNEMDKSTNCERVKIITTSDSA